MVDKISRFMASIGLYGLAAWFVRRCVPRFDGAFPPDAKVVHIYRKRKAPGGGYVGLNVSSDICAEAMRDAGINALSIGVIDSNGVDKVLFEERPSHLVVKAFWIPKDKLELLAKKYPSCQFLVVCHSKPSFLGQEGNGLQKFVEAVELSRTLPNVVPAANNEETAKALAAAYDANVTWAPNLMPDVDFDGLDECECAMIDGEIHVGMFCAIRPFKNVLNQAVAAVGAAQYLGLRLVFHVISERVEMDGNRSLDNLRLFFETLGPDYELIEHDWLPHDEFVDLVATMDVGMQASFTESFNIVTYDFLSQEVPIVVSTAVEWAPECWKANPDSVGELASSIVEALTASNAKRRYARMAGVRALKKYNRDALAQWDVVLDNAKAW